MGVGIGGPAPQPCRGYNCESTTPAPPTPQPSSTQTANTISQDLWEKSLPDGKTVHAVSGLLVLPEAAAKSERCHLGTALRECRWQDTLDTAEVKPSQQALSWPCVPLHNSLHNEGGNGRIRAISSHAKS